MTKCPIICNPGLGTGHSSTITVLDLTKQIDSTCNNALMIVDDPGFMDQDNPTADPFLSADKSVGPRAKLIASISEALDHFDADSEVVKAAKTIFENKSNGLQDFFLVGLWDAAGGESIADALDAIEECQPCFLPFFVAKNYVDGSPIIDSSQHDLAAAWAIANDKFFSSASHDNALLSTIDNQNIKGRLSALGYKTTSIEYVTAQCRTVLGGDGNAILDDQGNEQIEDWHPYREALLALYLAKVDFEESGSPYSWTYKPQGGSGWVGLPTDNLSVGNKVAVTGVLPNGFTNPTNNGYANVYVNDFGVPGQWAGKTVTGHWIDEQHLLLWVKKRLRQEVAQLQSNNRTIPYDDNRGKAIILNAIEGVMQTIYGAGWLNTDGGAFEDYERSGPGASGYGIRSESYQSVSAPRRSSRVAPTLEVCLIPAGSTQVLPISLCALADPTPTLGLVS